MIDPHSAVLLVSTLIAVVALILLVAVFKLNPFLSLFLVSLGLGVAAGMPLATIIHSFELGLGSTLGHIAIVVALGTMLGKMMAESGAAETDCQHPDPLVWRAARASGHDDGGAAGGLARVF